MGGTTALEVSPEAPEARAAQGSLGALEAPAVDRFLARARVLFYARLALLLLGLSALALPGWSRAFGLGGPNAFLVYFAMVAYSALNYAVLPRPRAGRAVTFATLCADLCVLSSLAGATGGLRSPLLAAQLLFATLFVVLFPTPLAVVPPLFALPLAIRLDLLSSGRTMTQGDLFVLLWYSAIDCILVYLIVSLNERDRVKHRELTRLGSALREMAVVEERNRLAREIHDGLGGVLSSVVIQSGYLLNMIDGSEVRARLAGTHEARAAIIPTLRKELTDLHEAAEESMDELRRSLRMMKEDFELVSAVAEYCKVAGVRHRLDVRFTCAGAERTVGPEAALAIFRVLQESLTNAAKHCGKGTQVDVALTFAPGEARLRVQDRGLGFDLPVDPAELPRGGHYGLANMRERANKVSGSLRVESAKGAGTRIELTVHAAEERAR